MTSITYSAARQSLAQTIKKVNQDREAVIVTSKTNGNVVIVSQKDYDALVETAYLLQSPNNAQRLLQSIKQAQKGQAAPRKLLL